jgi:DNA processing protein
MGLKTDQIVSILQLKGIVRKTAFSICEKARNISFESDDDLAGFVLDLKTDIRFRYLPDYNKWDINDAIQKGVRIIEESEKEDIRMISVYDDDYPKSFRLMPDKPLLINVKGNINNAIKLPGVALIGTRDPTPEGIVTGEFLGEYFGKKGYNVISGLAKGCDTAAHQGCLKAHGTTTAIVAHGLHMIYPDENKRLAEEILENNGLLISEFFIGTGVTPDHFIERDRLQAGLSSAIIVIQTAITGSTMATVNATLREGKPLAAVKYKRNITSSEVKGNEILLNEMKAFPLTSGNIEDFIKLI